MSVDGDSSPTLDPHAIIEDNPSNEDNDGYGALAEGKRCRELLERLKDFTFLVPDRSTLRRLRQSLEGLVHDTMPAIPVECGLHLLPQHKGITGECFPSDI